MISSSFDFLLQLELENFYFYQWKMSISVFKLFYSHNMRVKESDMGFRVCEWSSGENQFSPVTSLRFLNYRWWPIPHFSGIYFVCICEHICLTGYNELFLGKSIKIAINFYTKTTSRNFVVIDYSFCQAAGVVSEKTSFSCCSTQICKGLIEIPSHPWSIKIVNIEVARFKYYIPTRTFSKTQFQMLTEIPFRLLWWDGCKLRYVNLIYCDHIITRFEVIHQSQNIFILFTFIINSQFYN